MKTFRNTMKIVAGLGVTAIFLFAFIDSVSAKGPESLIITGPGFEHPVDLMDSYDINLVTKLLVEQTGLWYGTGIPLTSDDIKGKLGPSYTFTWINSGPPSLSIEERTIIQYIYLDAEGGPLIHTPPQDSLQEWGSGVIGWFAAPDGVEHTLATLGVPVSGSPPVLDAHMFKTPADTVLAEPMQAGIPLDFTVVGIVVLGLAGLFVVQLVRGRISTT
jgi:hypothetical protein